MTRDDCMELVSDPAVFLSSVTRLRNLFNVVSKGPVEYFAKSPAVPLLLEARSLVAPSSLVEESLLPLSLLPLLLTRRSFAKMTSSIGVGMPWPGRVMDMLVP